MVDMTEQDYRRRLYVRPEKIYTEQMGINRLDRLQTPEQKDYIRRITKQSELKKPYREDDYQDMEYHLDIAKGITIPKPEEDEITPPVVPDEVTTVTVTPVIYDNCTIAYDNYLGTWASVHDAATGNDLDPCTVCGAYTYYYSDPDYGIQRGFLAADLSGLSGGTVTKVELVFFNGSLYNANHSICIQEGTQSNPLVVEDYDAFTGAYFDKIQGVGNDFQKFTFNAAGLAYVQSKVGLLGGIAYFCLRDYDHDYLDSPPVSSGDYWEVSIAGPSHTTVAWRPYLLITYA